MRFRDRIEAGQRLTEDLAAYIGRPDVIVLGLPRGGVPVAAEVARALHAPLDVMIVRKLGVPGEEELAMGAISTGGVRVLNDDVIYAYQVSPEAVAAVTAREQHEVTRREQLYRKDRPLLRLEGKTVILVDDGIATGATMRAAIAAVRVQRPARIVVAVPVAATETCAALREIVDELVCVFSTEAFFGVGLWYDYFPQISDDEVREMLAQSWHATAHEDQQSHLAK